VHQQCFEFVARRLPTDITKRTRVVEFGSKDVNGNIHALLGQAQYVGIDIEEGPNVDLVMDCRDYLGKADIVLCLEVLEHSDDVEGIIQTIIETLDDENPNSVAIVTCATTGRGEHSAFDGGALREGEWYKNVTFASIDKAIKKAGGHVTYKEIDTEIGDLRLEIHVK
jgi:hypothetical protein